MVDEEKDLKQQLADRGGSSARGKQNKQPMLVGSSSGRVVRTASMVSTARNAARPYPIRTFSNIVHIPIFVLI